MHLFVIGKDKFTPYEFGKNAVSMSMDVTDVLIKQILTITKESKGVGSVFGRLNLLPDCARVYLHAAHIATFYVYSQTHLKVLPEVSNDFYKGISDETYKVFSSTSLELLVRKYAENLYKELVTSDENKLAQSFISTTVHLISDIGKIYNDVEEFKDISHANYMGSEVVTLSMLIEKSIYGLLERFNEVNLRVEFCE